MSIIDFYDELAPEYHLIYEDWNRAIEHQGVAIDRLIRSRLPDAQSVLDCSCGIGTQALGLAGHGYKVHGTDVSERALDRARLEAIRRGMDIAFTACDIRDLERLHGTYDVVMSCDNALPHLLTDEDVAQAFRAMCSKLRPGGLVVVTNRDYDKEMVRLRGLVNRVERCYLRHDELCRATNSALKRTACSRVARRLSQLDCAVTYIAGFGISPDHDASAGSARMRAPTGRVLFVVEGLAVVTGQRVYRHLDARG